MRSLSAAYRTTKNAPPPEGQGLNDLYVRGIATPIPVLRLNTRDPQKVSLAYTPDSEWRNRDEFFEGREAIRDFLRRKWAGELDYRLEKNLWCFAGTASR
jgi:hypothetical protein